MSESEKEKGQAELAKDMASFLWQSSTLRHGLFRPAEFIPLAESRIRQYLHDRNAQYEPLLDELDDELTFLESSLHGPEGESATRCRSILLILTANSQDHER